MQKNILKIKIQKHGTDNSSTYVSDPRELEAKSNLLKSLDIDTLEDDQISIAIASLDAPPSRSVSMAPLDLGTNHDCFSSSLFPQSINPNTLASLDAVGLPFFQAKDGGLASVDFKKFKKPRGGIVMTPTERVQTRIISGFR